MIDLTRLRSVPDVGARALGKGLERVFTVAQRDVPYDKGDLSRSGETVQDGLRGAVTYRDPKAVGAHENLRARHTNGRTAKWLENAVNSERPGFLALVAEEVRRALH